MLSWKIVGALSMIVLAAVTVAVLQPGAFRDDTEGFASEIRLRGSESEKRQYNSTQVYRRTDTEKFDGANQEAVIQSVYQVLKGQFGEQVSLIETEVDTGEVGKSSAALESSVVEIVIDDSRTWSMNFVSVPEYEELAQERSEAREVVDKRRSNGNGEESRYEWLSGGGKSYESDGHREGPVVVGGRPAYEKFDWRSGDGEIKVLVGPNMILRSVVQGLDRPSAIRMLATALDGSTSVE